MKKFLALMICLLLVFSCTVSAFAAEVNVNPNTATPDGIYESETYEFVSCTSPNKDTYIFEDCAYKATTLYPELLGYFIDVDKTGLQATLRNKVTGELEVFGDEYITCSPVYVDNLLAEIKKTSHIIALGNVVTDNGEKVPLSYTVTVTFKENATEPYTDITTPTEDLQSAEGETQKEPEQGATSSILNNGSATDDNAKSSTVPTNALVGNKVVNTGQVFPATVALVIVGCLAIGIVFIYRKRQIK